MKVYRECCEPNCDATVLYTSAPSLAVGLQGTCGSCGQTYRLCGGKSTKIVDLDNKQVPAH